MDYFCLILSSTDINLPLFLIILTKRKKIIEYLVMYKTIYVINIIFYMCSQHSNVL